MKIGEEITTEDVRQIAKDLQVKIADEQIRQVLEYYPTALMNDSSANWAQVIEQCFYDLNII